MLTRNRRQMAQYQHYIPQLILRNFSHPFKPPKTSKRSRPQKGKHKGDKVLNVVDLSSEAPNLLELPVSRWFGMSDMYKDSEDAIKSKKDVENELSKLESRTATILQKIKKAHEGGDPAIWLTRVERNQLRKFFFIMKYRGPGYFEKYRSAHLEEYASEDKYYLRVYMEEKGIKNPRDVWLANLLAILDLDMDATGEWMKKLPELMFPEDARMFIHHAQSSYMALCTPTARDDEFILTDACYNIYEGPTTVEWNPKTGSYSAGEFLDFHNFGPVSPRLIIVFRSFLLPEAVSDLNPDTRKERTKWLDGATVGFGGPDKAKSILWDLPVMKATNSLTQEVNGRLELKPGETGVYSSRDKFCFKFWQISTRHVDLINSIYFDNLMNCTSVVFGSKEPFKRSLEFYITTKTTGFKTIDTGEYGTQASRRRRLEQLSTVLQLLGSNVPPVQFEQFDKEQEVIVQSFDEIWLQMVMRLLESDDESSLGSPDSTFWNAYCALGTNAKTMCLYDH